MKTSWSIILVSVLITVVSHSHCLVGYDCSDELTEITTISLRDVAKCPKPELSYASEKLDVTVLQRNEIKLVRVFACSIEVESLIFHCGMHSHSSLVAGGMSNYVHRTGTEECRSIHRYHTFKLNQHTIGDIVPNSTTSASVTLLGELDNTGKCKGASYQEKGQSWTDVVILATVKIQIQDYYSMVKLDDNEISLKGGVTCPFITGYCFDTSIGESVWDSMAVDKCENQFSILYKGRAERIQNKKTQEEFLVVEQEEKIFALALLKKITMCNLELWQSEHPRILIGTKMLPIRSTYILPQNTDLTAYVNSKFLYIEQAYKRTLEEMYTDTIHRRCRLQREVLQNRLLIAPIQPNVISQLINNHQEGYIGRVLGEVLYIMKCIPRVASIRRTDRCYNELPIEVNNQSKFLAPLTRIIQNVAEEVDCNGLTPPLYYINNEWMGMAPTLNRNQRPQELEVETQPTLNFTPIMPLGDQGLYTREEASQVQRILTFGTERKAVENIITRRVAGLETNSQGLNTLSMFNPEELKRLATSTVRQVWGWFTDLGLITSGILGFYVIFQLAKYILGVIINALNLYKTFGGGIKMLACLWDTLTMWLIHDATLKPQSKRRDDPDIEAAIPLNRTVTHSKAKPQRTTLRRFRTLPNLEFEMKSPNITDKVSAIVHPNENSDARSTSPASVLNYSTSHWTIDVVSENEL